MKVLIFEDEFEEVKEIFSFFKETIPNFSFDVYSKSQSFHWVYKDYDKILVDLKLDDDSELSGYGILKRFKDGLVEPHKISVMTGHTDFRASLKENGVGEFNVIKKPVRLPELREFLLA